ncbi:MAG: ribonuclease III [Deltaproteobacteria bacterium]|nr:ribonuclease III [Deltaproteobacteria bacterium]
MSLSKLEKLIGYTFKNSKLLKQALCHSSFANEHPDKGIEDNERLEFLGDAVINLIAGHILMKRYPEMKEGNLSRIRARLVNESSLATIARSLELGTFINLGKGEMQSKGKGKKSILADAYEAVIAAVYLDSSFDVSFNIINRHFSSLFNAAVLDTADLDYKSRLQELVQLTHKITPVYRVVSETGPDHDKTFEVMLKIRDISTTGRGKNKKSAEQDAAGKAFTILKEKQKSHE